MLLSAMFPFLTACMPTGMTLATLFRVFDCMHAHRNDPGHLV